MPDTAANPARKSLLEKAARPLLLLAQKITGMETTLVTSIDWAEGNQKVLYSLNQGLLEVAEGLTVDWHDSMCRSLFLSGVSQSCEIGSEVPATAGAIALGIQTFFAVPILLGDNTIGTVCGASQRKMVLDDGQMASMQLIADALQELVDLEHGRSQAQAQSEAAMKEAVAAKLAAERHAADSLHMEYLAHTDVLTGLPNRRAFMARWEDELARSGRRHYPIGLMLIDADHFKSVNDTAGHAMGDAVLSAIGATLIEVADSPDVVARLGGDEFALVTTHTGQAHLEALAERIQQLFAKAAAELGVTTTLSIGMVSSDDCPRDRLLNDADAALYRSKHAGGNTARMFTCATGTRERTP